MRATLEALRGFPGGMAALAGRSGIPLSVLYRVVNAEHARLPVRLLGKIADAIFHAAQEREPIGELACLASYGVLSDVWTRAKRERELEVVGDAKAEGRVVELRQLAHHLASETLARLENKPCMRNESLRELARKVKELALASRGDKA